jgi:hypothetical protein
VYGGAPDLPDPWELENLIRQWPGARWRGVIAAELMLRGKSTDACFEALDRLEKQSDGDYKEALIKKSLTTAQDILTAYGREVDQADESTPY